MDVKAFERAALHKVNYQTTKAGQGFHEGRVKLLGNSAAEVGSFNPAPSTVSFSNSHLSPWVMDRRLPVGRKGPVSVGWMWGPQDAGVSVWNPERGQRGPWRVCRGRSDQGAPSPHRPPRCVATTQGFYPVPTPGNGHCLPPGLLVAVPENQSLIALCSSPPVRLSKPRNRNTGPGR